MAERATVPLKLFWLVKVTVSVVEEPTGTFTETGFATMVKSGTVLTETVTVAVRAEVPMDPVIVIVYVPVGVLTDVEMSKVELADPPGFMVTLCGLRDTTRPLLETEKVRLTVPEKPFSPVTVIVELPGEPA